MVGVRGYRFTKEPCRLFLADNFIVPPCKKRKKKTGFHETEKEPCRLFEGDNGIMSFFRDTILSYHPVKK